MAFSTKKRNGFSLVGILVGVSLLGILTVGMMQVFSNMMKGQNYGKFRSQVENFSEEFRNQLGTKDICTATFTGTPLDPATTKSLPAIVDATGKKIYAVGDILGDHSFTLASMTLKSAPGAPWYADDASNPNAGKMILTVNYQAIVEQAGSKDLFRTYTIATHRDNQSKLVDCTALSKMSDGLWRYNPSSLADIYYFGGNVGIGTTAPNASLQVVGSISTTIDTKTASYTLTDNDNIILGDATTGAIILTLPDATKMKGRQYTIKKQDASPNLVSLATTSNQLIDGNATYDISAQYQFITATSNGTGWSVTGSSKPSGGGGNSTQIFLTSGTWTNPGSGTIAEVSCWGGGGGGARSGAFNGVCGGGGGGYSTRQFALSTLPSTVAVTVGKGGLGATAAASLGSFSAAKSAGSASSFGTFLTATGGSGSPGCGITVAGGGPVAGGSGGCGFSYNCQTSGDVNAASGSFGGGGGGGLTVDYNGNATSGTGGFSMAGGPGGNSAKTGPGGDGTVPGGGGGASYSGPAGNGADGECIVKVFQ